MKGLNYYWRLFGTAVSFSTFGIGGLILTLTIFPMTNLFVRAKSERAIVSQRIISRSFRLFVGLINVLGVFRIRVHGGEKLMDDRGTIVISNHPTLIDVVILISLLDRAQCIVKRDVWRNPFMRGVVSTAGYIPNDENPDVLIDRCTEALEAGNNLVIFPEGSRTRPGVPLRLQRGVANIALSAGAPIRLVTITCQPSTLTKGEKWYRIPDIKSEFEIIVHDKLYIDEYTGRRSIECRRLTRRLTEMLTELGGDGKIRGPDSASYY